MSDDQFFARLAEQEDNHPMRTAPARLKSRTFTRLIRAQRTSGPLLDFTATKKSAGRLCVFEELVQIAPVGTSAKSKFYCEVCHARWLAESVEHAPIWWPHCPYVRFQNH
jgi:hypothetical protein